MNESLEYYSQIFSVMSIMTGYFRGAIHSQRHVSNMSRELEEMGLYVLHVCDILLHQLCMWVLSIVIMCVLWMFFLSHVGYTWCVK